MPNSNLKNIVVLKNLPSNLVDEAIVILKSNKDAKKLQFVEKSVGQEYEEHITTSDYIIKEAESVIASYITRLEKNKIIKKSNNNIETKYKKIKVYSIFVSIILVFCFLRVIL